MSPDLFSTITENPVAAGLIALVLFTFVWVSIKTSLRAAKIKVGIATLADQLQAIDAMDVVSKFADIQKSFKSMAGSAEEVRLEQAWQQYEHSLLKTPTSVRATRTASSVFQEHSLVNEPLGVDFNRHLPGIFTAMGIIGTFVGIYVGLQKATAKLQEAARMKDLAEQAKATGEATTFFLTHVGPAFVASLVAVFAGVAFLWLERKLYSSLASDLQRLQSNLDRLFVLTPGEEYLRTLVDHSMQQTRYMKEFSVDLAGAIEKAMELLVAQQIQEMKASNERLAQQMAESVGGQLGAVSENLRDAVKEMKREQAGSTEATLTRLVEQFQGTLSGSAQNQLQEMAGALSGAATTMEGMKKEIQEFIRTLSVTNQRQSQSLHDETERLRQEAAEAQKASRMELDSFLQSLGNRLQSLQAGMMKGSGEAMGTVQRELSQMVRESLATQEAVSTKLVGQVEAMQARTATQMEKVLASISSSASAGTDKVIATQTAAIEKLSNLLSGTQREMEQTIGRLSSSLTQNLGANLEAMTREVRSMAENMRESTKAVLGDMRAASSQSVTGLQNRLSETLEKTATEVTKVLQEVASGIGRTSHDTLDRLRTSATESMEQFSATVEERLERVSEGLGLLVSDAAENNHRVREQFSTLSSLVTKLCNDTHTGGKELADRVQEGAKSLAEVTDKLIGLSISLAGPLTALREASGSISEASGNMEEVAGNLGPASHLSHEASTQMLKIVSSLSAEQSAAVERLAEFRKVCSSLENMVDRQSKAADNLGAQYEHLFEKVQSDLVRYNATVSQSLREYLSKVDEYLSRAAGALSASVDELNENVADLAEAVRKLPPGTGGVRR